jgi:heterodisulfide reductase subunit A
VEPGESEGGREVLKVTVTDLFWAINLSWTLTIVSLAAAVVPSAATKEIAGLFKVTLKSGRLLQRGPCEIAAC